MSILTKSTKTIALLSFGLMSINSFAADACKDEMGHSGNGTNVSVQCGNDGSCQGLGSISGTPWGLEEWYSGGGNNSMTYYSNGTFQATWSGAGDYLARVGFQYNNNYVKHTTKSYAVDYKYTKTSKNASYGYIGVYGWTRNPDVEYYIVDDWYSKPNEQFIGPKFGELNVDGGTYTIHAFVRDKEYSKLGQSTFLQIFSVRTEPRQCGHINISAHFKKWDELFKGQTENLPTSKHGRMDYTVGFGDLMEVMLMSEAGGDATGSIDYTYFNMVDNAEGSTVTSSTSTNPASSAAQSLASVGSIPGTIEIEDYQNSGGEFKNNGTTLGSIEENSWVEYAIDVSYDGTYDFSVLAAREDATNNVASYLSISIDGEKVGTIEDILTTGWTDFQTFSGVTTKLTKGPHTLRVDFDYGWIDIDNISFTEKEVDKSSPYVASSASTTNPASSQSTMVLTAPNSFVHGNTSMMVFDMQGRALGRLEVVNGTTLADALFAKFQRAGVYMVKQGSRMMQVRVNR